MIERNNANDESGWGSEEEAENGACWAGDVR